MKKSFVVSAAALVCSLAQLTAAPLVVADFEETPIGTKVTMWNRYGDAITSTAKVEADPANAQGRALHVSLNDWNTYVELPLPDGLTAADVAARFDRVEFDLRRAASDPNDYKQFWVLLGEDIVYQSDGYPHQGNKNEWQHRTHYFVPITEGNTSTVIRIGLHSDKSDYYIDNITLKGKYDDYVTIDGGLLDICTDNTDKNYAVYTTPLMVTKASPLTVRTSRYTEFRSDVAGDGVLSMYCGGERTFLGTKDGSSYPSWREFTGELHIYPYDAVKKGCGFYGLILNAGGKTFNPEDIEGSLQTTNSELLNCKVTLHPGATLATPKGNRAVRIGHLETLEGSRMCGPLGATSGHGGYYVLGHDGKDAALAGRIAPPDKNGAPFAATRTGIVKEGAGNLRITANDNLISGAIRICEGTVTLANDVAAARTSKLGGAVGALAAGEPGVYVFKGGNLAGNGHSASVIDLYGHLRPGDGSTGTFTVADFATGADVAMRVRPSGRMHFEIRSAADHDRVAVDGPVDYWNIGQDFAESKLTPVISIEPTADADLKAGDEFTLLTARSKTSRTGEDWKFRVQYPKVCTWEVKETLFPEGGYALVARVVSLDYSGQGDVTIDDEGKGDDPGDDDDEDDGFDETTDPTPLREYASKLNKYIGVAAPCWSYDLNDDTDYRTALIGQEFNMVVSENGTKHDATEPSRDRFDFTLSDRAVNLALRHGSVARGHTFVWHKQVASWVTSNGEKNSNNFSKAELLEMMKNHIFKLAEHYKGKITEWDVVNECLSDNQTAIRSNPDAYDLRASVWNTGVGEEIIDSAFVWAHRADPSLKLYLTDYGVEFKGIAKTEALYNLAKRLLKDGRPIHGVGLQCHLDAGSFDAEKFARTVESYAELGLECIITELDMGVSAPTEAEFEQQARDFAAITKVWLTHDNCPTMVVWGLLDSDSWRHSNPLLFNGDAKKKPAYYAVHRQLRRRYNKSGLEDGPQADVVKPEVKETVYYNLLGQRISGIPSGMVIEVVRYTDGSTSSRKLMAR